MTEAIDSSQLDPTFKTDVANRPGGENIALCYACGTCTASCPVSGVDSEFNPRQIIRQVLLGMRKQVLGSPAIWRCVQCYACTASCPQSVKFRDVMRALRGMAVEEKAADPSLPAKVEDLGQAVQKMRRDLVAALAADPARFDEIMGKVKGVSA
jgi:heterodisulfide reductase subunit C